MPGEYGVLHLTDLVQSDVPHSFHCGIFLAQMAFSHGQASRNTRAFTFQKKLFLLPHQDGFDTLFQQKVELLWVIA